MTDLTKCIEWSSVLDSIYIYETYFRYNHYGRVVSESLGIEHMGVTGIDWGCSGMKSSREETHSRYKLGQNNNRQRVHSPCCSQV